MLAATQSYLISVVLDECLCQVKIIGNLTEVQKIDFSDESETTQSDDDDILYTVDTITANKKLKRDLKHIESALEGILKEIKMNGTYTKLTDFTKEYRKARTDFEEFRKRIFEEKTLIPKMKKDISDAKRQMQEEIDDIEEHIKELNFALQKRKSETEMEKSYVRKTIENDVQQGKKKCACKQEYIKTEIKRLKYRLAHEAEADAHITKFWKENEEELLRILQYWKHKFFDDQKRKEGELAILKKYKKLNLDKIAMVSRKLQIDEDYLENDKREKQREQELIEQEKAKNDALIRIQAWWRGEMVRKKLGPFAEKKPKKEKKGKKGKGKKKK